MVHDRVYTQVCIIILMVCPLTGTRPSPGRDVDPLETRVHEHLKQRDERDDEDRVQRLHLVGLDPPERALGVEKENITEFYDIYINK